MSSIQSLPASTLTHRRPSMPGDAPAALSSPAADKVAENTLPGTSGHKPRPYLSAADMRDALQHKVILLLGYPGAGKGTQGKLLETYLATGGAPYPHLSTGELFRAEVESGSETGQQMQTAMLTGVPISDEVVFPYLQSKLARHPYQNGFMLDGFPKNASSYHFMMPWLIEQGLTPLVALHIQVPRQAVQDRLAHRLHCRPCAKDYQPADFAESARPCCKACNGPLARRDDDQSKAIVKRLDTFDRHTAPLLPLLLQRGLLVNLQVKGQGPAKQKEMLHTDILRTISERLVAALPQQSYHPWPLQQPPLSSVFHNHVDARNPWVLADILKDVARVVPAAQNKIYPVSHLTCGPQTTDPAYSHIYGDLPNFHAISPWNGQAVEAFSTGNMGNAGFDYNQIRATLAAAYATPNKGVMTELEEEIYESETIPDNKTRITLDRGLTPTTLDRDALAPWIDRALAQIPAFEMHHAVDLPKYANETAPPFALGTLMDHTTAPGFNVGGWFIFAKKDRWAFRSNEFTSDPYEKMLRRLNVQIAQLRHCVRNLLPENDTRPITSRASVEKVHAIWHI